MGVHVGIEHPSLLSVVFVHHDGLVPVEPRHFLEIFVEKCLVVNEAVGGAEVRAKQFGIFKVGTVRYDALESPGTHSFSFFIKFRMIATLTSKMQKGICLKFISHCRGHMFDPCTAHQKNQTLMPPMGGVLHSGTRKSAGDRFAKLARRPQLGTLTLHWPTHACDQQPGAGLWNSSRCMMQLWRRL